MFGSVTRADVDALVRRADHLENLQGNSAPRIGSLEYQMKDVVKHMNDLEARMNLVDLRRPDRAKQRQDILIDEEETSTINPFAIASAPAASHRGEGRSPLPCAEGSPLDSSLRNQGA